VVAREHDVRAEDAEDQLRDTVRLYGPKRRASKEPATTALTPLLRNLRIDHRQIVPDCPHHCAQHLFPFLRPLPRNERKHIARERIHSTISTSRSIIASGRLARDGHAAFGGLHHIRRCSAVALRTHVVQFGEQLGHQCTAPVRGWIENRRSDRKPRCQRQVGQSLLLSDGN
jgi:hypothetical protein